MKIPAAQQLVKYSEPAPLNVQHSNKTQFLCPVLTTSTCWKASTCFHVTGSEAICLSTINWTLYLIKTLPFLSWDFYFFFSNPSVLGFFFWTTCLVCLCWSSTNNSAVFCPFILQTHEFHYWILYHGTIYHPPPIAAAARTPPTQACLLAAEKYKHRQGLFFFSSPL